MKVKIRFLFALAVGVMMVSVLPLNTSAAVLRGDVNGNGTLDLSDVISMNKFLQGMIKVEDLTVLDYDVNGIVSQADSEALTRFLVHLDSVSAISFPIAESATENESTTYCKHFVGSGSTRYSTYTLSMDMLNNSVEPCSIYGKYDDRVYDGENEAVVRIDNLDVDGSGGTGFIVGAHTIATAGHCLYDGEQFRDNIAIKIIDENKKIVDVIYPVAFHVEYEFIDRYDGTDLGYALAKKYDVGMIEVGKDLSEYGCFSLGVVTDEFIEIEAQKDAQSKQKVTISGFPGNIHNQYVGYLPWGTRYKGNGLITSMTESLMEYTVDTGPGMSGGPVYCTYTTKYGVQYDTVIGINIAGADIKYDFTTRLNTGLRLNSKNLQFYLNNPKKSFDVPT